MKLTPEQEDLIADFVDAQGLTLPSLRDDVIDHLCCVIEQDLHKGKPFDQLLQAAVLDLAPHGLKDIQTQTVFLLNSKRIIVMKKLMYLVGFLGAITLTAGVTLKLLNIPWGYELFSVGFLTLLLGFIPLLALDRYKVAISKALTERLKIILGAAAAVMVGLSGVFKILHLQGAEALLMLGAIVFAVGFLPFFFFTMYKRSVS